MFEKNRKPEIKGWYPNFYKSKLEDDHPIRIALRAEIEAEARAADARITEEAGVSPWDPIHLSDPRTEVRKPEKEANGSDEEIPF